MRATVRALLLGHAPFAALFPTVIEASAVRVGVMLNPPFAVIRMGGISRGQGTAVVRSMDLWLHDTPGDYGRIDEALREARIALDVWNVPTTRGWLMRAAWTSDGIDAYDDGFKTITRSGSWELTGTGE